MSSISKKLLAAGLLTAGVALFAGAPAAVAAPLPDPEPAPPVGPVDGVPESAPAPGPNGQIDVTAPEVGGSEIQPGVPGPPVDSVPNINGDPCTGEWESVVCYADQQGDSPVVTQPRTSISSSP